MDTIVVGFGASYDVLYITSLLDEIGIAYLSYERHIDVEVNLGLKNACDFLEIKSAWILKDNESDATSNGLTQLLASDLDFSRDSKLSLLLRRIEWLGVRGEVFLMFAHGWDVSQEIRYFEGDVCEFKLYLKINRGAFCLVYNVGSQAYNVNLDTPLVWRFV